MSEQWKRDVHKWTIEQLHMNRARININPRYQRQLVWDHKAKKNLIMAILKDFGISMLMFHINSRDDGVYYDIVDGKQRVTTLWEFMDDSLRLSTTAEDIDGERVKGKKFSQLSSDLKRKFRQYAIPITEVQTDNDSILVEQFISLQRGKALTYAERRMADVSHVKDVIELLQKHPLFGFLKMRHDRYQDTQCLSRLVLYEYTGAITTTKHSALDKFFIVHANDGWTDEWQTVYKNMVSVFDLMFSVMPSEGHIRQWTDAQAVIALYFAFRRYSGRVLTTRDVRDIRAGISNLQKVMKQDGFAGVSVSDSSTEASTVEKRINDIAAYLPNIYSVPQTRRLIDIRPSI